MEIWATANNVRGLKIPVNKILHASTPLAAAGRESDLCRQEPPPAISFPVPRPKHKEVTIKEGITDAMVILHIQDKPFLS